MSLLQQQLSERDRVNKVKVLRDKSDIRYVAVTMNVTHNVYSLRNGKLLEFVKSTSTKYSF